MTATYACPDTLIARARKGPLPMTERAQLDRHVRFCATCRTAFIVGIDIDRSVMAQPGDEVAAQRIAAEILSRLAPQPPQIRYENRGISLKSMLPVVTAIVLALSVTLWT